MRKPNEEHDEKIAKAYLSGMTITEVGESVGLPFSTVRRSLIRTGTPIKDTRGRDAGEKRERDETRDSLKAARSERAKAREERNAKMAELYLSGMSIHQVGERFGMTFNGTWSALRMMGVKMRPRGGANNVRRGASGRTCSVCSGKATGGSSQCFDCFMGSKGRKTREQVKVRYACETCRTEFVRFGLKADVRCACGSVEVRVISKL